MVKKALVGYTGFVGSNINNATDFDEVYNSKNIEEAYGTNPELLVYAGLRAEKYLANNEPQKDMDLIIEAEENIKKINPKNIVLISTIDVFKNPMNVNEETEIETEELHPYGYNRYVLEQWVRNNYPNALIIRLPGLFGENIKKNFIYDYINVIPFMLKEEKMEELSKIDSELKDYYKLMDNGFYKLNDIKDSEREVLKEKFKTIGFSALNFTDSRSVFQFYDLSRLWADIEVLLENGVKLWHAATEPISAGELYEKLTGRDFKNEVVQEPSNYNFHTIYANLFSKDGYYIESKEEVINKIKQFVEGK